MDTLETQPRYIYKIVPSTTPIREPLPETLPVSELDRNSGFIHLSMASQVPNTLKFFFSEEPVVYILRINHADVIQDIRWESPDGKVCGPRPGEGLFPVSGEFSCFGRPNDNLLIQLQPKHLYNGLKLGKDEVESIAIWQNDGGWDKALDGAKPWLLS